MSVFRQRQVFADAPCMLPLVVSYKDLFFYFCKSPGRLVQKKKIKCIGNLLMYAWLFIIQAGVIFLERGRGWGWEQGLAVLSSLRDNNPDKSDYARHKGNYANAFESHWICTYFWRQRINSFLHSFTACNAKTAQTNI